MIPWFRLPMSWGIHLCFQFCVTCSVAKVQSLKLENWKQSWELTYPIFSFSHEIPWSFPVSAFINHPAITWLSQKLGTGRMPGAIGGVPWGVFLELGTGGCSLFFPVRILGFFWCNFLFDDDVWWILVSDFLCTSQWFWRKLYISLQGVVLILIRLRHWKKYVLICLPCPVNSSISLQLIRSLHPRNFTSRKLMIGRRSFPFGIAYF